MSSASAECSEISLSARESAVEEGCTSLHSRFNGSPSMRSLHTAVHSHLHRSGALPRIAREVTKDLALLMEADRGQPATVAAPRRGRPIAAGLEAVA